MLSGKLGKVKSAVLQRRAPNLAGGVALPKQTHIFKRGSVYYFRLTVPPDGKIGKREIIVSLKTGDIALARRRAAIESVTALAQIDDARRKLAEGKSKSQPGKLSKGECWEIAARWFLEIEKEDILPSRERLDESRRIVSALNKSEEPTEIGHATNLWLAANGYDRLDQESQQMLRAFNRARQGCRGHRAGKDRHDQRSYRGKARHCRLAGDKRKVNHGSPMVNQGLERVMHPRAE